jgi:hypothetical protein
MEQLSGRCSTGARRDKKELRAAQEARDGSELVRMGAR